LIIAGTGRAAFGGYTFVDLDNLGTRDTPNHLSQGAIGGQSVGSVNGGPGGFGYTALGHAALWNGSGPPVILQPTGLPGIEYSIAWYSNGAQQVGFLYSSDPRNQVENAMLWNGSAESAVDLNPAGISSSVAWATDGLHQVGSASVGTNVDHAMLWTGTAASAVDLHPGQLTGAFNNSVAYGTDGDHQVGNISSTSTHIIHAALWSGSAASAVDLNPAGFVESGANGVFGDQEVGSGNTVGPENHALLWKGTAASAVDLNGGAIVSAVAYATNGQQQVGVGNSATGPSVALLWSGSAASTVDLSAFMPTTPNADLASYFITSTADSIDAQGNVFGRALDAANNIHAVEWALAPEPTGMPVIATLVAIALTRRRRISCRTN
jgi:hypothetical protein